LEPALYVVATPIGNLADLSQRARETLAGVAVIAAEDTRHSGQLLKHEGISTPLMAYHEHSSAVAADKLAGRIRAGEAVALICDAGTPSISDPGYRLVRAVQGLGCAVVPVPGACAAIAALSAAGLPTDRFSFEGFLPQRREARRKRIEELATATATLVFYEAPHRIAATLEDFVDLLGPDREAAFARELTKRFETIRRATLGELLAEVLEDENQARGEIVLLLGPTPKESQQLEPKLRVLLQGMAEHMPARSAAKLLSSYSGLPSRQLYESLHSTRGSE